MSSFTGLKYKTNEQSTNEDVWKIIIDNDAMTNEALLVSKGLFFLLLLDTHTTAVNAALIQIVMASNPQYIASFRTNEQRTVQFAHVEMPSSFLCVKTISISHDAGGSCFTPFQRNASLVRLSSWDGQIGDKLQWHENQVSCGCHGRQPPTRLVFTG